MTNYNNVVDYAYIGLKIKKIRKEKKVTQAQLAECIDCSVPFISHIETARKTPSLTTLVLIARALGVKVDTLIEDCRLHTSTENHPDIDSILIDCNSYEKQIIIDLIIATKTALRKNKWLHK